MCVLERVISFLQRMFSLLRLIRRRSVAVVVVVPRLFPAIDTRCRGAEVIYTLVARASTNVRLRSVCFIRSAEIAVGQMAVVWLEGGFMGCQIEGGGSFGSV